LQTPSNRRGARLLLFQRINEYADGLAQACHEGCGGS
jgi:hypothetical protein